MKLAMVADAIYPYNKGGKETRIFEISTRLVKRGDEVHIYCMKWWDTPELLRIENGVHLHAICQLYPLYFGERRSIKQAIYFSLSCLKLLLQDFDVIDVDHMPHLVIFPLKLVSILKRKLLVVTWHEVWGLAYWKKYLGRLGWLAALIEKISVKLPDRIISVSPYTTFKLKREFDCKQPIFTIPLGIDIEAINKALTYRERVDIVFAGRLLAHKHVDMLIQAIHLLKLKNILLSCTIIGEGPEKNNLITLVNNLGLSRNVKFIPFFEDHSLVYGRMKASRMFVLPSDREGFGISVLEAQACGIPVIVMKHKDNAAVDLIKPGINGLISPFSVPGIARTIEKILETKYTMKQIKRLTNVFDLDNMAPLLYKAYAV